MADISDVTSRKAAWDSAIDKAKSAVVFSQSKKGQIVNDSNVYFLQSEGIDVDTGAEGVSHRGYDYHINRALTKFMNENWDAFIFEMEKMRDAEIASMKAEIDAKYKEVFG